MGTEEGRERWVVDRKNGALTRVGSKSCHFVALSRSRNLSVCLVRETARVSENHSSPLLSSPLFTAACAAKDRCPSKYKFAKSNSKTAEFCRGLRRSVCILPLDQPSSSSSSSSFSSSSSASSSSSSFLLPCRAFPLPPSNLPASCFQYREPCRLVLRHHRILLDVLVPLGSYVHLHHLLPSPSCPPSFLTSRFPSRAPLMGLNAPLLLRDLGGSQIHSFGCVDFRAKFARLHESVVVGQDLAARAREERRKRARKGDEDRRAREEARKR